LDSPQAIVTIGLASDRARLLLRRQLDREPDGVRRSEAVVRGWLPVAPSGGAHLCAEHNRAAVDDHVLVIDAALATGEWEVRADARAETCFHFRTGITSVVPWLVVCGFSSLAPGLQLLT
jgi:hypothetical protein